jgi:spore coat protein U-like protein
MTFKKIGTRTAVALAVAGALAGTSVAVQAATATGTLPVTAQVAPVCEIVSTAAVAFGTLNPTIDNDTTGTINWQCTVGTSAEITLDGGINGTRLMDDGGANTLAYELYTDVAGGTVWLNTVGGGVTVAGIGYTGGSPLTVFGRVTQAAAAAAVNASYTDSVTVTITY